MKIRGCGPAPACYDSGMASDDPVVVSIGKDHYETHVRAARHEITADEPASVGGTDKGLNPYQLLLASIGTCKAITLRMYADRKSWDLEQVAIALRHERRHAEDCEHCDDSPAMIEVIDIELQLLGDLTATQRERLAEIADRCPVHRTLSGDLRFETSVIEE